MSCSEDGGLGESARPGLGPGPVPGECSVEGCSRRKRARGLCAAHYEKERKAGAFEINPRLASPEESFIARTEPLAWSGCLIWTGARTRHGYGVIYADGKATLAHRYSWEREHGPIPEGVVIDHRYHCDPACCEPAHLRTATQRQNVQNRSGAQSNGRTGVRNVTRTRGTFKVQVRSGGKSYGHYHSTIEAAAAEAKQLRRELFGEYAGAA